MGSTDSAAIEYLLRKEAVVSYLHWLARLLDDFKTGQFAEEFLDGGTYRLVPRENFERNLPVCIIDDTKERLIYRSKLIDEHWHYDKFREVRFLSNIEVSFSGDGGARSMANFSVARINSEGEVSLHMVGRLEDTFAHHEGRWRIKDRLAILESYLPNEVIVLPP